MHKKVAPPYGVRGYHISKTMLFNYFYITNNTTYTPCIYIISCMTAKNISFTTTVDAINMK